MVIKNFKGITINRKEKCVGCYACVNECPQKCISMEADDEGFWYPKIDYEKCTNCKLCFRVCPIINNKKIIQNELKGYAGLNKNESIRISSSSGGIFTLISEQIIDENGVVFGAGFNNIFEVEHSYVEKKNNLDKFRGSKYVQSKIGITYTQAKKFLESGRIVLFTGTSCQIGGLRSYLKKSYKNLFCIDVVCHGVPSPTVWKKYVEYREEINQSQVQKISFRDKRDGWRTSFISFWFQNNTKYQRTSDDDLYMTSFLKNICLRPSCYSCKFKNLYRQGDITLGDFWGIENILPELDDNKGISLIIVNNNNGRVMLEKIKNNIFHKKINLNDAIYYNSPIIKSVNWNSNRKKFFQELDKKTPDELIKKYCSDSIPLVVKKKVKLLLRKILVNMKLLSVCKKLLRKLNL